MVMNRRRKENTGNGVSSFADLEDQHRQEAQRQVQSVSRSNINARQAEQNMNNLIQQQNQQANVLRQYVDSQANRAEEDRSRLKEYVQEGTEGLAENLTRSVDKRGSGARGDDLLSEIASGQTLQSLEQQDLANRAGEGIDEAGRYTKMGGQQLLRGSVNELNRIFNESEQGYMDWYQSSPENSYMQYAARNMNDQNADLTDINAGQDIQRQAQENFDRSRNWWRDALREKADSATDEELYQLFMAQNPTSNGDGFDPEQIRQNMRDTAELATDEWFTNVYNANENELSGTEAGQLLESVGSQVTRGTLAQLAGNALGGFGLNVADDPQAYMDAVNAMTGRASLGMMGYGIAGSSTGEKIAEGYDPDRALAYGLTQAGIELGTEKMGDVLAPLAQKAGIDTSWLFNNVTAGQAMGLRENFGEGVEEFVGQMLDPFSEAILHPDMTAGDALKQSFSKENLTEALKAGVEGIASAALTGVATNPVQSAQMYAEDIQNLRNLPGQFDKDMTILANKINNTNEYEKALNKDLVSQRESELEMMPEGQDKERVRQEIQADKENIRKQYIGENGENLVSEDSLVREAAQAANRDNILEQARKAGVDQKQAEVTATLANRAGRVLEIRDRESFVNEFGKNNGLYDTNTGRIVLSAGTKDPFLKVATHEITHSLEGTQEFDSFMRFLSDAVQNGSLTTDYGSYEHLQDLIKETYADQMATMTPAQQEELLNSETTAFLSQELMGNEDVINSLVANNRSLAQTIYDGLRAFTARVTNNRTELDALDTQRSIRRATELFAKAIESSQEMERAFDEQAKKASKVVQQIFRDMTPEEMEDYLHHLETLDNDSIEKISQNITGDDTVRFSLTLNDKMIEERTQLMQKQNNNNVSAETMENANAQMRSMADIMQKALDENHELLPGFTFENGIKENIGKTLMKDASYGYSVENTTVCVRTLAYNELTNYVSEKVGRPLTAKESMLVSQMLYDIAVEPQCLYCYVSLDRKSYNEMVLRYLQERDAAVKRYKEAGEPEVNHYSDPNVAKDNDPLFREFLNGRKPTKNMMQRYYTWIDAYNNGEQFLTEKDVASDNTRADILARGTQEQKTQLQDILKYAQAASWAKKSEDYRAYYNDILKMSQRTVNKLNQHYGLRWYSFSDYTPAFILENMQQFTDAAVKGLKGLAYTKDTDFAEIFAPTGVNINISVFADVDKDGNFFIDPKISADIERAIELREQYPNVGIVVVAARDDAIRWALDQEWSDVVIPFHIVRSGNDIADFYHWSIYNKDQNDTISETQTWEDYVRSLGKDPASRAGKNVSRMIYPSEHQNDLNTYLNLCRERGLTPRFSNFIYNENGSINQNYMKLVNETRLAEKDTPYLQPVFDLDAAERSFKWFEEKGGYFEGWYQEGTDLNQSAQIVADDIKAIERGEMDMHDIQYGQGFKDLEDYMNDYRKRKKMPRAHGNFLQAAVRRDIEKAKAENRWSRDLDSTGKALSEGQAEFFSKSQARDDEGRLLRTYHGTPTGGFTIYDRSRLGSQTHARDAYLGHHFTDSKELADSFVVLWDENQKGETKEQYLNITKPLDFYSIVMGKEFTDEEREQFNRDMKYILTGDADYVADWEDEDWDTFQTIAYSTRKELGQVKDELAKPEAYARMRELGYDGYIAPLQENDAEWLARKNYPYKDKREFVVFDSEQAKNVDNLNPTNNPDIRYSKDLLDDNNLAKVNPIMIQKGGGVVDYRLSASERQIDRSKIPASVLDKAYTYTDFAKKFEKKNKTYSDMTWLGQQLRQAQEEVNKENAEYRGKEAFGGGYGEVIRRLKEAGVKDPREVIDQYLDRITWKGTQEADAAIENDPNASVIMREIKTNLDPKFIENLQNAHFASQRKAQKTRDESKVKGTEAYYRKSLEKGRSYVKERTSELLKGLGADIDMRMSPMKAQEYFGGNGVVHSPIGDARAALRESGITKTSEYSDWLKLYFLESLEGYKHNDEMLSRLKDKILADEQLASDSDMANGGFEYMLEQLDNAAKRYLRLKEDINKEGYNADNYMADLYQETAVVPLTEKDHMSTATRDLRLAGALGTTANDPRLAQVAEKVESIIRDMSADESITGMSYTNFDPNDRFARNNPYMKRIYEETGIRDEWIIDQIYHDMKLAHGRNNQRPYIPAPTQAAINLETAKRRAESAAKTREFFNNRDSLNEAVEEASANETPEETIPVEDIPVNEEQVNTSAYGAENYMFPGDLDDPRRFQQFDFDSDDINPNNNTGLNEPFSYEDFYQRIYEGDDYQTQPDDYQFPTDADAPEFEERIVPTDEYTPEFADQRTETEFKEATEGVNEGNYVKLEDYMPGKLFSEMTEEDIRKTKQEALQKKEYIDTLARLGLNKGSTAMTLEQNRDQIADGNKDVDKALYELFENPFADATEALYAHWDTMAEKLDYVVNKLGIKERSKESEGMQWYMERTQDTRYAPRGSYTLEHLKRDFPNKWQDIKKGAEILEEMYDEYFTKINESLEMNYPEKVLIEEEMKIRQMLDNQIEEKQALLRELMQDPQRNADRIAKLRSDIRKIAKRYNNIRHEVRVNKRLPLRQDYAHHFLDTKPTLRNIIQGFRDVYNNMGRNNISNELAAVSADTKPLTRWWGAMQRRKRGDYTRDAIGGMLRYWDRAEQKIFIDPYSGYLRGVVSELAKSADEAEVDQSSMIRYYSAFINSLTGKTNPYDRWLTYAFNGRGRQVVSILKSLNGRIKSNAVVGNINSAIAQWYNLPNAMGIMTEKGGAKAVEDWKNGLARYMQDKFAPDAECDQSTFLKQRYYNSDVIEKLRDISTPSKFAGAMMEFGDRAVAEMTWYAAKAQGERLGVGNTVRYADEITRRAVAGRGIGEVPISQQAEIVKLLTPFQVEVNNAYQLLKHLNKADVKWERKVASYMAIFLTAFFMNAIRKKVTNTDGTGFDPIGAIVDAFKEKGQWRDVLDSEEWDDIVKSMGGNLLGDFISNMPYGSLIAEFAGLSSNGYGNSYFGERDPTRYGIGNIGIAGLTEPLMTALFDSPENVDWTKLITNYGLPYGGKQAERTIKTMQDLGWIPHFGQGNYSWKEGAYTKNGDLKYVIDTDNPLDVARALIFGTYASEAGQEYLENRRTLGGNGVTVFNTLVDAGVDSSDAYQAMMSLKDVEYPHGLPSNLAAPSVAKRKALEDAGVWDEWSEAYNNMDEEQQDAFRSGTGNIAKGVIAMDDEEFQRAYDAVFGTGEDEAVNVPAEAESVPAVTESASMSPSRQQAYDTVTSADIGVDSDRLSQTMSSLATQNLTDADGNKIDNSRSAVNRLSYEEDGSYQAIIDFIESDENKNSDDPLTYADFGLSKSVVNMDDEELEELLEQINEGTGSTYRRRSGGSSRGNSRRANAFRRSGTSAIRSLGNQHISTYVPKKKGSYTRSTDTIRRLQNKTKSLSNGVMQSDVDLYDSIFNK